MFGVVSATYTDRGGALALTQHGAADHPPEAPRGRDRGQPVRDQHGDHERRRGGTHRGSLGNGDWIQLNGPFNLVNINSITFRVADAVAGRTAGTPLAAIEVRQDSITGPIITTANLVSTGGTAVWTSQTFPISMTGLHEVFLVFRSVPGGETGGNLFNLNWTEFNGKGIAQ